MKIVDNYIKPFDLWCVKAARYTDKIIVVGAISNIIIVAAKCLLYVASFFFKFYRKSEFLTYLEGRTFKECARWIFKRKEMIQDRATARIFDYMILNKGDPYEKLSMLQDLSPKNIVKDPKDEPKIEPKVEPLFPLPKNVTKKILDYISITELQSKRPINKTWNQNILKHTIQRAEKYGYVPSEGILRQTRLKQYQEATQHIKNIFKEAKYIVGWLPGRWGQNKDLSPEEILGKLELESEAFFKIAIKCLPKFLDKNGTVIKTQYLWFFSDSQTIVTFENLLKFFCTIGSSRLKESFKNYQEELKQFSITIPGIINQNLVDELHLLLILGFDLNTFLENQPYVLSVAISHGYQDMTKILLNYGVNANGTTQKGYPVLNLAIYKNDFNLVCLLLEKGASPKHTEKLPEMVPRLIAATYASLEILEKIWEWDGGDIEVDRKSPRGSTALLCAAESTDEAKIRFLLKKNASLIAVDGAGNTPLSVYEVGCLRAQKTPNQEIIKLLTPKN